MTIVDRLHTLGVTLPTLTPPTHGYVRAKLIGELLFVAGHGPRIDGGYRELGLLGRDVSVAAGSAAARICALNCLGAANDVLGSLDRISEIVRLTGYVASAPGFADQAQILNGASALLVELFGEAGRHVRTAVGVAMLPGNIPVEVELICAVHPIGAAA